jgi:hypothetical protein
MVIGTFHISKGQSKAVKAAKGIDVAARYFVYKLYEATDGQPMQMAGPAWDGRISGDYFPGG